MKFTPRPYQNAAVEAVTTRYKYGNSDRMILYLPTGSGKTVIATLIIQRLLTFPNFKKVLFITHSQEIVEQTAAAIKAQLPEQSLEIEQGKRTASRNSTIIVASIQSLVRRKARFHPEDYALVICDECHRSLAPSWNEVIDYFSENQQNRTLLLGMTATPRRSDGRSALEIFKEIAFEISHTDMQDLGYLVPMEYYTFQTNLNLAKVQSTAGDFQVTALSKVMNLPEVRALTIRAWQEKGFGKKTIVFCAGVKHAHQIAADFLQTGINAVAIDGKTPNREDILQDFKAGNIQMLTNYGVLTEGFDEPTIECILLARPTTSPLVYTQCIGRGLRIAKNKSSCTIIDIIDRSTHQLQYGVAAMAELPRQWKSQGRDPFRESQAIAKIKLSTPEAFIQVRNATCLEEVQSILMRLPPATVIAGLDGHPVIRYDQKQELHSSATIKQALINVLMQANAAFKKIKISDDLITITFPSPQSDNEKYAYLIWHMQQLSKRDVVYQTAFNRTFKSNPKALLRSMLTSTQKLETFDYDRESNQITANITGLVIDEVDNICDRFHTETGINLYLTGQISLPFF